ncbi:hypothetical protein [Nonomuraea bangladeshensis]|uniref:hypothetical protein n=1 Tax=Nonomuraea bangladeshensis TaxID=404385 RepID=UPI0031CDEC33
MAASFQTPAMAGEGPEPGDLRYDAPIARPIAAPVAGYDPVTGNAVTAAPGESGVSLAPCDDGRRVLGGGWTTGSTSDTPVVTFNSAIANGAAWQVAFRNLGGEDLTLTATAQCAFVRPTATSRPETP